MFEDVNFLGNSSDLEFKRDSADTHTASFPFLFKRLIRVNTGANFIVDDESDQRAIDSRGFEGYYWTESSED